MTGQQADLAAGPDLPATPDLVAMERAVALRWRERNVPDRSLRQNPGGTTWICQREPPAASGMPGIHQVPGQAVSDLYHRLRTMQGFRAEHRAGWDCHGLMIEVAVEKELGLSGRKAIEAYGVDRFNARCRESALRHLDAHSALSDRLGSWPDPAGACLTMDSGHVDAVWSSLHRIFRDGLLIREHRVTPYCPRCQTPLSDHEAGRQAAYRKITDEAVTVRFRLRSLPENISPLLRGADLLSFTTAPWTLVSNAAIAVHPHQTYVVGRRAGHDDRVIVAEAAFARVLGAEWHIAARFRGADLTDATYVPAFSPAGTTAPGAAAHRVVPGYFVSAEGGTGLSHLAPAFGASDLETSLAHGLPVISPIGPDGRFDREVPLVGGVFFKDADRILVSALADRGLLFASRRADRSYPHCWRCGTPLMRCALPAWYVRAPASSGRDWMLSRTRYWGTPLPLWECAHGHVTCVASLRHLSGLAGRDLADLDPHRPAIDEVTFGCPQCGAVARRVPDVIDASYDCGVIPFGGGSALPASPAGSGQDPLAHLAVGSPEHGAAWLHALSTVSSLVAGLPAAETPIRLGPVLDSAGRTMSRARGNLAEPLSLLDRYGADALRWLCTAASAPTAARRLSDAALGQVVSKVLLRYWNVAAFFVRYANAAVVRDESWSPAGPGTPEPPARPLLDRWLLSELQALISAVTTAFEAFQPEVAGRAIDTFIDSLSNWYLRRSRSRFGPAAAASDRAAAFATLHECLDVLTRLMAPVVPFVTDQVWDVIRASDAPDSVHLTSWPAPVTAVVDERLMTQMAIARAVAELGRSARAAAMIRLRQPLDRALVTAPGFAGMDPGLRALIADELNVRAVEEMAVAGDGVATLSLRPSAPALGRRFGKDAAAIAAAISAADPALVAAGLNAGGTFTLALGSGQVELSVQDVIMTRAPLAGWAVASAGVQAVALDTVITPELRRAGLARDAIRLVQQTRKASGLDIGDLISLRWSARDPDLALALAEHGTLVSTEILAAEYGPGTGAECVGPGAGEHVNAELGLTYWMRPHRSLPPEPRPPVS